jgi:penicillin amidase
MVRRTAAYLVCQLRAVYRPPVSWPRKLMTMALGRRLPQHEGTLRAHGLRASLRIGRDDYGVPYVDAASEHDAWFALGFCHAQDRGFQLELTLRAVRGTLAAVIGEDGLPIDRLSRRLGFRRAGAAQLAVAETAVAEQLAAYTRGVNQAIEHGPRPHELVLLGCRPTRWEPADVQAYSALFCFMLASNWDIELLRLKVFERDGGDAVRAIDPGYPSELPVSTPPGQRAGQAVDYLAADVERLRRWFGAGASNSWALSSRKTATGRPLLASDPHLLAQAPGLLYLASLRWPSGGVVGATFVGFPAFVPGHNGHAAWGATAAHADNTDLFLERIGPDGESVLEHDGYRRCELREEVIEVKGRAPVVERVLVTPRGPIISPALDAAPVVGDDCAISMAASWLKPRPYTGFFRCHEARSFEQFRAAFAAGSTATVCLTYADVTDTIGFQLASEVPLRRAGSATMPMPGWDADCQWHDEPLPYDELPRAVDPTEGFLCTANNQPTPNDEGPYLGVDWLDGFRQQALTEALAARSDWSVAACAALQLDTRSLAWRQMRGAVLATPVVSADARWALELLAGWDGDLTAESVAASVYQLFVTGLCAAVAQEHAPRAFDWALGRGFTPLLPNTLIYTRRLSQLAIGLQTRDGLLVAWDRAIDRALGDAMATLRRCHGDDPAHWCWGAVRPLRLVHALSQQPPLGAVFDIGPLPGAGDSSTIAQGGVDLADPLSGQLSVAQLRAVFDVGNWDACRFSLCGGQSGNPASPHYDDQLDVWSSGQGIPIAWSDELINARIRKRLRLVPKTED